ncbi:hypothetical protein H5410_058435 [Solanum commersonii]|uniref:Uncharacterized protein n=1 Tax=Solanum commersonii TaxID=4109 RepID=A0A9J5WSN3_SOLCO|nr:hypothetical protein H5410_058435 [Solanum commersonii]
MELEVLAKQEEVNWRQKSRALWLKQGDNNTTARRRYNTIDKLLVRGEETQDPKEIKEAMIEFHSKLYTEPESWRPSFEFRGCPTVSAKEMSGEAHENLCCARSKAR